MAADWGEDYPASLFAFAGTKDVKVEGYADYFIIRGFCGVEGYDLVFNCELSSYLDEETGEEVQYYAITEVSQIINGEPQKVKIDSYEVEGATYYNQYLETGNSKYSMVIPLDADGITPYYSDSWNGEEGYAYFYAYLYDTETKQYTDVEYYYIEWNPAGEGEELEIPEGLKSVHLKSKAQWGEYNLSNKIPFTTDDFVAFQVKVANATGNFQVKLVGDEVAADDYSVGPAYYPINGDVVEGSITEYVESRGYAGKIKTFNLQATEADIEIDVLEVILVKADGTKAVQVLGGDAWDGGAFEVTELEYAGIDTVEAPAVSTAAAYNLFGQPIGSDYKGIVIMNGKKIMK